MLAVGQSAPGRYATEFETPLRGEYLLRLTQTSHGRTVFQQTRGLAIGYPEELRLLPTDLDLLRQIASSSGGRFRPEPESVFAVSETAASREVALWPYLGRSRQYCSFWTSS